MFSRSLRATPLALALALTAVALTPASHAQADDYEYRHSRRIHLLLGIGAEGGGFVDQSWGLMGGGQVHAGVHIHGFEMYGLTQAFFGSLTTSGHASNMTGLMWNSAMFGFGAGVFHIAAGPSLDFAWGCTDPSPAIGDGGCYNGAPLWGIDARIALQFGMFEVSANVHPTFYGRSTVTGITLGLGWAY